MSTTPTDVEDEDEKMLIRAITDSNVKKLEQAITKTKKHGKGFVLTSQFSKPKRSLKNSAKQNPPFSSMIIGSPLTSPTSVKKMTESPPEKTFIPRSKSAGEKSTREPVVIIPRPKSAYITEYHPKPAPIKVDVAVQSDETTVPRTPPGTPNYDDEEKESAFEKKVVAENIKEAIDGSVQEYDDTEEPTVREEPAQKSIDITPQVRISESKFTLLALPKRPTQFAYDPESRHQRSAGGRDKREPDFSNIWYVRVPKKGANVRTPFYTQVEIPNGALRGDVIMKFETQRYSNTKIQLEESDKLCSDVIDVNVNPAAYHLHKEATVKMRILEDCINKHESVVIVNARHFKWKRLPTKIETRKINGDTHFYAVISTQYLGKFAVITTRKKDRFVLTAAGGLFSSTVFSGVSIKLTEGALSNISHMVQVAVTPVRNEALEKTGKRLEMQKDMFGELVASSPLIEITKHDTMRHGLLHHNTILTTDMVLSVPVATHLRTLTEENKKLGMSRWVFPTLKIMRKKPIQLRGSNGSFASFPAADWDDISEIAGCSLDAKKVEQTGEVKLIVSVPSQVVVLVFDHETYTEVGEKLAGDYCDILVKNNNLFEAVVMIHHKTDQPEIINIHLVPEMAVELIAKTMEKHGEWEPACARSKTILVRERQFFDINFNDGLRLTVNQGEPRIQFNSRKWQGFQFQLEATDETYSNCGDATVSGELCFIDDKAENEEERIMHKAYLSIPYEKARPYRPSITPKQRPIVTVVREYKYKWLKTLSEAEKQKYKNINTP